MALRRNGARSTEAEKDVLCASTSQSKTFFALKRKQLKGTEKSKNQIDERGEENGEES